MLAQVVIGHSTLYSFKTYYLSPIETEQKMESEHHVTKHSNEAHNFDFYSINKIVLSILLFRTQEIEHTLC
jgi:hypothetical protein